MDFITHSLNSSLQSSAGPSGKFNFSLRNSRLSKQLKRLSQTGSSCSVCRLLYASFPVQNKIKHFHQNKSGISLGFNTVTRAWPSLIRFWTGNRNHKPEVNSIPENISYESYFLKINWPWRVYSPKMSQIFKQKKIKHSNSCLENSTWTNFIT